MKGMKTKMSKLWDRIKLCEPLYRALKTFFEAFVAVIITWIANQAGALNWADSQAVKTAVGSLIIVAVSTGLGALLNVKPTVKNSGNTADNEIQDDDGTDE